VEPQKVTFESDAAQAGDNRCIVEGTLSAPWSRTPVRASAQSLTPAYPEGSAVSVNVSNPGGIVTEECIVQ
jgi:hypothetical protein